MATINVVIIKDGEKTRVFKTSAHMYCVVPYVKVEYVKKSASIKDRKPFLITYICGFCGDEKDGNKLSFKETNELVKNGPYGRERHVARVNGICAKCVDKYSLPIPMIGLSKDTVTVTDN